MEENQFDSSLGGSEHLPQEANSLRFAASRSIEIAAMTESILRPSKTKLIFQTLPVHMRRRVMSHNCKRLPRKLREGHLEQLKKSGLPPKQKRPSRKYRRRPGNLMQEYNRRQRRNVWLETHIWHAKRFHMIERWGFKIPYAPCDKAFRACYRATSAHCLIQDVSYLIPIKITGCINTIKHYFATMTNQECGLSIGAKANISGNREGSIHLYRPNQYPYGYIGKVNFIWEGKLEFFRTLWLFCHPAYSEELKMILTRILTVANSNDVEYTVPEKKKKLSEHVNKEANVVVSFLPYIFNRFRLTGPLSHSVLARSLIGIQNDEDVNHTEWISLLNQETRTNLELKEKFNYWVVLKEAGSPAQLPPRLILSLIVKDPRLSRPARRTKATENTSTVIDLKSLINVPSCAAHSPLWNLSIHQSIKSKMLTNTQFIERVTKTQLIPGEVFEDDPLLQTLPIILIQRPGSQDSNFKKIGYGCGWDVIIPSGYGMPFWQTFIMFGARAGGLRESESLALEMGECYMPPDSDSGKQNAIRVETELKDKYFKLPPSKRVNYTKLAINNPFLCHWEILLNDWSKEKIQDFHVLRNKRVLEQIQDSIYKRKTLPELANGHSCLVPLYLQIVQKGNMKRHAIICIPRDGDVAGNVVHEPHHDDPNEKLRKELRRSHKIHMKSLKRKNIKLKRKGKLPTSNVNKGSKNEPSEYVKKMRKLWLPANINSVRKSCSREVIGYVIQGGFSFSAAHGCSVGYVAYNALRKLVQDGLHKVLIRNTTSRTYRLANFHIIMS